MKNLIVLFALLLSALLSHAQPFDIYIFLKDDCERCSSAAHYLDSNKIIYNECYVSESFCSDLMWEKLENVTSEKNIIPPVILIGSTVVFPVFEKGRLMPVTKHEFLDRLYSLYYTDQPLPYSYGGQNLTELNNIYQNSQKLNNLESKIVDIKNRENRFYIIGGSFLKIQSAVTFKKELISKGFENSKILKYRNYYRVSVNDFSDKQDAINFSNTQINSISTWIVRY